MPTIDDAFQELQAVNQNLQQLQGCCETTNQDLEQLQGCCETTNGNLEQLQACCNTTNQRLGDVIETLNAGFTNMSQGFQALITLQTYANGALANNARQNMTIICALEKISDQTCSILNEAHTQTGLETSIEESSATLRELYKSTHPDAALVFERGERLREQIEECCPPEEPEPVCAYEPCPTPRELGRPPDVDYNPFEPAVPD
jgi:DNA repair exonuclease SbcCD ATPase subunit